MKIPLAIFAAALLLLARTGLAQSFVNLNFEAANPSGYSPGSQNAPISSLMPGWSGYFVTPTTTNQTTQIGYDGISLGGYAISINDINTGFGFTPLQGKYSVYLFGSGNVAARINQTALVPVGAQSIFIDVQSYQPSFMVWLGSQTISMVPVQTLSNYTVYGGDISMFAGQLATLCITQPPPLSNPPSAVLLDDIQFSTQPISEPSGLALFGAWALMLTAFRWGVPRRVPSRAGSRSQTGGLW